MKRIVTVVGARPQFIKAAPVSAALREVVVERFVHTGQHHDPALSASLFAELGLRAPDIHLAINGGGRDEMIARMLTALDPVLAAERPDAVLVYGDTNSTLAGAWAARKRAIPVIHVEAGLRSFDSRMPEERNRIETDRVSAVCFCTSQSAAEQLRVEGSTAQIHVVGDVMQDALLAMQSRRAQATSTLATHAVASRQYILATIHRAENTDSPQQLAAVVASLAALPLPVLLPLHPRTRKALTGAGLSLEANVRALPPLGYGDSIALMANASCIVTDSGGVQKEAYWLGVPCVTVRQSTEWTETVAAGWNRLCSPDTESMVAAVAAAVPQRDRPQLYGPPGAAQRIAELLPRCIASIERV